MLWAGLSGLTISSLHGIGHNFMHQADNLWMRVCTLGGSVGRTRPSHAMPRCDHRPPEPIDFDFPEGASRVVHS